MPKSKAQIQADVGLSRPPSDRFMELLGRIGDGDVIAGPALDGEDRTYTPSEIETIVLNGAVGSLLAHAREEADRSLAEVGDIAGVTRARVSQIEQSANIEVTTLVRFAAACGYEVDIRLKPLHPGQRAFSTTLQAAAG